MALRSHVWLLAIAALIAAVTHPLITYTVTLATFGAAHVLAELRYVDTRFGHRLSTRRWCWVGAMLGVLVLARLGVAVLGVPVPWGRGLELGAGIALALSMIPGAGAGRRAVAVTVAAALTFGLAVSPVYALLAVAVLHNLTPLAFLHDVRAEAAPRLWRGALLLYLGAPLLIASGLPYELLRHTGLAHLEAWVLFPGPLEHHMRSYIPAPLLREWFALHAFSACAFLQCMHYLFVIDVLPRRFAPPDRVRARWPRHFARVLVGAVVVSFASFVALGFAEAKVAYGALAAVHAWLEVPVLIMVLSASTTGPHRTKPRSPATR